MSQYVDQRRQAWIGRTLVDRSGQRIGRVEDIYTDDVSHHPAWIAVATGRLGLNITFLPLAGATPAGGDELQVPFSRNQIKEAPPAGRKGRLAQDEVIRLYDHYGFDLEAEEIRERAAQPGQHRPAPVAHQERAARGAATPRPSPTAVRDRQAAVRDRLSHKTARERQVVDRLVPAAARRAAVRERSVQVETAPPQSDPHLAQDNPLLWNHDDRIDSIRPPATGGRKARR